MTARVLVELTVLVGQLSASIFVCMIFMFAMTVLAYSRSDWRGREYWLFWRAPVAFVVFVVVWACLSLTM